MLNFQKKIEEMQRKLNIINEDIEEIKNERKSYDKNHKLKIYKANTFLQTNNKRKNFFRDSLNNDININNNSVNYVHKKNLTNSQFCQNMNNTGRALFYFQNTNFNLTNENLEEIPKNHFIVEHDINNNSLKTDKNASNIRKDLTINNIDDYSNKKNNNLMRKYKTSASMLNVNNNKDLNFQYTNSINNEKNNEYFYKNNSLYQNYCHMKKNLNNINLNDFNSSQTIINNNNKIYYEKNKNKTFNNTIKDLSSKRRHKRIKKIIVEKKIKVKNIPQAQNNKNFFNNEFNSKQNKNNGVNKIYKNNHNHKTIDINYNYSVNNKNLIYDNKIRKNANGPIKIKTRNNNNTNSNNQLENIAKKEKNYTVEDIQVKNQRSMSIENPKVKFPINNKNLRIDDIHTFHEKSMNIFSNNNSIEENNFKTEKINYINNNKNNNMNNNKNNNMNNNMNNKNKIDEKKLEHEKILFDIINITNQYNDENHKTNVNNIINQYKLLLYDNKIKNEFISKVINLYNKSTKSNLKCNDNESLIPTWNWIKDNQNKLAYNKIKNETENKQYKKLCKDIMNEYNLKNIEQLKLFIHKLCKKVDKNENFLEGIKKILLP